jgi:NodT family efflux transporter outer membrane factor (OMF) lipoprotein
LSAAYEIDLWGRIRSGIQAEKFRARASLADYQTGAISLSAEIAITWYQLVATVNQLSLVEQQITTNENIVSLIRARFGTGQISAVDILRQMQLLESTQDQKIMLETDQRLLRNQLSVLLGKQPQTELEAYIDSLPDLPPLPETGLPLELVRRRPDIQTAYNLLLAADRDMATAVTSKYPRLALSFSVQQRSNDYSSLFQDWAYSIAGNLVAPLLYGGRLRAEAERTEAVKYQRLYEYGQTVLIAFREVEDALIKELKFQERMDLLNRRLDLAQKTNVQLRISFLNGLSNYLDVLVALDQEQQLRRDWIVAKYTLVENRIALYRALAGSFETERETNQ